GGEYFGNYEGLLPRKKARKWYECDANYRGKSRGAERVIYSTDGLYYYTDDHFQTYTQMFSASGSSFHYLQQSCSFHQQIHS
ncbi:MAG: ribonuclease domain-containing protein, partial [bacterium]